MTYPKIQCAYDIDNIHYADYLIKIKEGTQIYGMCEIHYDCLYSDEELISEEEYNLYLICQK